MSGKLVSCHLLPCLYRFLLTQTSFTYQKEISEILVVNIAWLVKRKASALPTLWSALNTHQPYSLATSQARHMPGTGGEAG